MLEGGGCRGREVPVLWWWSYQVLKAGKHWCLTVVLTKVMATACGECALEAVQIIELSHCRADGALLAQWAPVLIELAESVLVVYVAVTFPAFLHLNSCFT